MRHRAVWTAGAGAVIAAALVALTAKGARGDEHERKVLPTVRPDSLRNFELKDLDGKPRALSDLRAARLVVLAWTEPGCPVAMLYGPRVAALAGTYESRGVRFLGVVSGPQVDVEEAKAAAKGAGVAFPVLRDEDGALAQRLGVETTTAVVVLDENRRVRYRGAVDDQYGVGGRKPQPTKRFLEDALEDLLAGRSPSVATTAAPGCPLDPPAKVTVPSAGVTWNGGVGAIVQKRCAGCHREGEAAPFPLVTFADAKKRTATMRDAVTAGRMPPWHALGPAGVVWSNDRRLTPVEKDALLGWLGGGAPEGKGPAPVAPGPTTADGWEIGKPDAVFTFERPEDVPAEGVVPYRFVEVATNFEQDRWFDAVEVRPGAPQVVHHVLVAVSPGGRARRAAFAPTNGFLAAMVPGGRSQRYPEGTAKRLPAHARLLFQMHYTPNGTAASDATSIGFHFLKSPPRQEVHTAGAFNAVFRIPPGEGDWEVKAMLPVLWDTHALAFMPHMHVRGKSFKYSYKVPGGAETTLCEVPAYDFNWQTPYRLKTPVAVPKGTLFLATARFDNSEKNPYNPDPKAEVHWGDQTWDEMMIGYVDYVRDDEDLTKGK